MKNITMKSTKEEIMNAYLEQKKKLDEQMAAKDDPVADAIAAKNVAVVNSADAVAGMGIFDPAIVQKYKDLCDAIKLKEKELQDLYGIEKEANTMVSLINAHKDKERELVERYKTLAADAEADFAGMKTKIADEIESLKDGKAAFVKSISDENAALMAEMKKKRDRDTEEYGYEKNRARKIENDKWEDEKACREKVIADREAALDTLATELETKANYLAEMESKVSEIPQLINEATEAGIKKGKADADKSNAFETRALTIKHEYATKALNDKIARLESDLAAKREENDILRDKLDMAYSQMKDLASETVKSSGGVKILSGETSGK